MIMRDKKASEKAEAKKEKYEEYGIGKVFGTLPASILSYMLDNEAKTYLAGDFINLGAVKDVQQALFHLRDQGVILPSQAGLQSGWKLNRDSKRVKALRLLRYAMFDDMSGEKTMDKAILADMVDKAEKKTSGWKLVRPAPTGKEARSYEAIGTAAGQLVQSKNEAYGDSFARSGEVLKILYPAGVAPEQYRDMLAVIRIIDKLFRVAARKDAFGESPYGDIIGYGILGQHADEVEEAYRGAAHN